MRAHGIRLVIGDSLATGADNGMTAMARRLIRQHDQFFKWMLDQPGVPAALLEVALPSPVRALWSGAAPEALPRDFVTRELDELRTDRAFRLPLGAGAAQGTELLVLFEHKAHPDRGTAWQVTRYLFELIQSWLSRRRALPGRQRHRLPLAVAVVVYHGPWRWTLPQSLAGMATPDESLWPFLSNLRYVLVDVLRTPIETVPAVPRLRAALLIWRIDLRSGQGLHARLSEVCRACQALGLDDLTAAVYYLMRGLPTADQHLLRQVLTEVIPKRTEAIMQTIGDELMAQGRVAILMRQFNRRFGTTPAHIIDRLHAADNDQLDLWAERVLDARSFEDVFGPDAGPGRDPDA